MRYLSPYRNDEKGADLSLTRGIVLSGFDTQGTSFRFDKLL